MQKKIQLQAALRQDVGKGASRRLRHAGKVPAIIYGGNDEPQAITLEQKHIQQALMHEGVYSQILTIEVINKTQKAILRAIHRHPYKPLVLHMDFQRIDENKVIALRVPLHFLNEATAPGVKIQGGVVSRHMNDVEISSLPSQLPEFIAVDLANLGLNEAIHLADLQLSEGVRLTALAHGADADHNAVVVSIHIPKIVVEEEPVVATEGETAAAAEEETAEQDETDAGGKDKDKDNNKNKDK